MKSRVMSDWRSWVGGALLALGTAALIGAAAAPSRAQPAAAQELDARGLAALVQSFYDQTTSVTADFHQTQYTKVYQRYDRARGRVVFQKPGKMRWNYAAPNGQVFVADGDRLLVYQPPEEGETRGQMIDRAVDEDSLPQAFAFLMGTGRLDEDFDLRLLEPSRQGFPEGQVLELRPRTPSAHYDRVLFFVRVVEQGGRSAGIIQRVLIIDAQGNRNRFDFRNLQFNRQYPTRFFRFEPPAGTRTVRP